MASAAETEPLRLGLLAIAAQYDALAAQADGRDTTAAQRVEDRTRCSAGHRHEGVVVLGLLSDEVLRSAAGAKQDGGEGGSLTLHSQPTEKNRDFFS